MRLSDSDDDTPAIDRGEPTPTGTDARPPDREEVDPVEFVDGVADVLDDDPDAAANAVGGLLTVARENGGAARVAAGAADAVGGLLTVTREETGATRVAAGEALDAIGRRQPSAFEVWSEPIASAARSGDEEVSFFGMRALAQLAGANPRAASKGLDAALSNLRAPSPDLRRAALSVVAEVGPDHPDSIKRADRPVAESLQDGDESVRTAAAIAAGRLLAVAPNALPRTATALVEALDDEGPRVREFAHVALANFAREHPDNVPQKARALQALAGVTDDELGLRRGALGEAMSALVAQEFDGDAATG